MIIWPMCARLIEPWCIVPPISPQIMCFFGRENRAPMDLVFGSPVDEMMVDTGQ